MHLPNATPLSYAANVDKVAGMISLLEVAALLEPLRQLAAVPVDAAIEDWNAMINAVIDKLKSASKMLESGGGLGAEAQTVMDCTHALEKLRVMAMLALNRT